MRRAIAGLVAGVVGPAALVIACATTTLGQTGPGFATNIDPLFQGALTRLAHIDNTIQYGMAFAANGDIESAISIRRPRRRSADLFPQPEQHVAKFDMPLRLADGFKF